jgi:hypothetical protein
MIPRLVLTQIIDSMSYSSRKRARPESATNLYSSQPTKKHKQTVAEEASHCTIRGRISVKLGGGLNVFPLKLRKFVAGLHIKKTKQYINSMLHGKKSPRESSFSIVAGHRERPSSGDYKFNSVTENIPTANVANMNLLRYAMSELPGNPQFLELSDVGDLVARETVLLHTVHLGEVGWAIDRGEDSGAQKRRF